MPEKSPDDIAQEIVIYAGSGVEVSLPLDRDRETVWASQAQIAELFGIDRSGVTKHVNNIFRNAEVDKESNVQNLHIATADRPVALYSLDVILAVGYRANSGRAILFRRWASGVLKDYIVTGVAINSKRLDELGSIVRLLSRTENELVSGVADVLAGYIPGLQLLREYDDGHIAVPNGALPGWELTIEEARAIISRVGTDFPQDKLFGYDPQGKLDGTSVPCTRASVARTSTRPSKTKPPTCSILLSKITPWRMATSAAPLPSLLPSSTETASYMTTMVSPKSPTTH